MLFGTCREGIDPARFLIFLAPFSPRCEVRNQMGGLHQLFTGLLKAGQVAVTGKDPKLVETEKKRVLRSIGIADLGPSAVGWLSN